MNFPAPPLTTMHLINHTSTPTLSSPPREPPATSGSPGGQWEPPGPSPLTAPVMPATTQTNCIWQIIKLAIVCITYTGPQPQNCKDDLQVRHRYKKELQPNCYTYHMDNGDGNTLPYSPALILGRDGYETTTLTRKGTRLNLKKMKPLPDKRLVT